MSTSRQRQPSGDEPSVVVRHVGGRRVVSRSNPEISYAYGAPAVPGSNSRKRRTTSTTPGPEEETAAAAADASTSSVEQQQQNDPPDPKARYQALKRRKLQEAQQEKEREQQEREESERKRQEKGNNKTPSKGGRASTARSPRKTKDTEQVEQRLVEATLASQQRKAVSSHDGSDDVSNSAAAARQRMMSPGRSRSLLHGQLNSFYMDRDASTEEEISSASGARDEKNVPSSILLGAQRQGHDMLSGMGGLPELDSIHSSDIHDSRSRDYSALQREADLLADEGSSVSGSVRNAPLAQANSNGLRPGFKGKGAANRTADRSTVKAGLNGIAEESDAELSATEGLKHSQRTTGVERKKASTSSQSASSQPDVATAAKSTTAIPHQIPRPIARSSPRRRNFPWLLLVLAGLTLAALFGMQQRGLAGFELLSPLAGNATLSDQALRLRIHALEKRLQQAEKQASLFDRQLGETKSAADRAVDSLKNLPAEIASIRDNKDEVRKIDAALLQELKKMFVAKGENADKTQSWDSFRRANEEALRKLTASIVAEEARKGTSTISRSTVVALLQDELEKLKATMEVRFNENVQGVQNDILAKVRAQQDMFERSGSWKKQAQAQHKTPPGAEKGSIEALIEEALEVYAADRIGERDFALYSAGGRIIPSLTSATYGLRVRASPWLGWLGISTAASSVERVGVEGQPPVIALVPDNTPGMCWAFAGSEGQLGISLARRVVVSKITLEHTPASISHEAGISAPRDVTVWGIVERPSDVKRLSNYRREQLLGHAAAAADGDSNRGDGDIVPMPAPPSDRHLLLASFTYDAFASRAVQSFQISQEAMQLQAPVAIVQVRIHTNHGKPDYTCLYRVRIHGREWTLDDELASAADEKA